MSTKISVKKGGISVGSVLVSYIVAWASTAAAKAAGIEISADQQAQLTAAIVAGLTGLITGGMNWFKHRPKAEKK